MRVKPTSLNSTDSKLQAVFSQLFWTRNSQCSRLLPKLHGHPADSRKPIPYSRRLHGICKSIHNVSLVCTLLGRAVVMSALSSVCRCCISSVSGREANSGAFGVGEQQRAATRTTCWSPINRDADRIHGIIAAVYMHCSHCRRSASAAQPALVV